MAILVTWVLLAIIGLSLGGGGLWLVLLGGSFFYLFAGLMFIATAILLFIAQSGCAVALCDPCARCACLGLHGKSVSIGGSLVRAAVSSS